MPKVSGTVTVTTDDSGFDATPIFANFLRVSYVGAEVQFEFIYVDIAELAQHIEKAKSNEGGKDFELHGETVAKVIVPSASFVQLKEHLVGMFGQLEAQFNEQQFAEKTTKESGSGHGD